MPKDAHNTGPSVWFRLRAGLAAPLRWLAVLFDGLAIRLAPPPVVRAVPGAPAAWLKTMQEFAPDLLDSDEGWKRLGQASGFELPARSAHGKRRLAKLPTDQAGSSHDGSVLPENPPNTACEPVEFARHTALQNTPIGLCESRAVDRVADTPPPKRAIRLRPTFSFPGERSQKAGPDTMPGPAMKASLETYDVPPSQPKGTEQSPRFPDHDAGQKAHGSIAPKRVRDGIQPVGPDQTVRQKVKTAIADLPRHCDYAAHNETMLPDQAVRRGASVIARSKTVVGAWPDLRAPISPHSNSPTGFGLRDDFWARGTREAGKGTWNA
ncbi:hypothetical protein [Pseudaestuariivita rosea]|uniref:hypothetical protein n=1 Tax=Pseudaestuariivita rosea TaxID=2763263 RepID=UPI001ABA8C13|nr:hypothetical protein [Pseudaestuariivita rosea]